MPSRAKLPVIFSPAALADLDTIIAFRVEQRGEDAGEALLDALMTRTFALRDFPLRGARPKEHEGQGEDDVRQIVSGPYRILYDVQPGQVLIVLIADGRRDMVQVLRDRALSR